MARFDDTKGSGAMDELRRSEAKELAQILSARYGIPYVDLGLITIDPGVIRLIPETTAREAKTVVFQEEKKVARIAILTPNNERVKAVVEELERTGYRVEQYITSEFALEKAWEVYHEVSYAHAETAGVVSVSQDTMDRYVSLIHTILDVRKVIEDTIAKADQHALSTVVEIILGGAIATRVSDIHMEPEKEIVHIRFRLDGVLQNVVDLSHPHYHKVLSRIKLLAGVKLNVTHEAQDGRFTIKIQGIDVEVRTSILPSTYKESVVMRILNPKSISVPMEELGMDGYLLEVMQEQISKPNGLILTTGPTGSGKTTTLYAILKKLRSPEIKIITIEDPVEYHLDGISQTQVDHDKGYDFHNGLRAAVRQDPDVIMVGEIRDDETAGIAIDSALTGHLVFSTLHTNNAAGAIPRLIDLSVNPKILSSALNITLGQRLVRRLCVECKEQYQPEGKELEALERIVAEINAFRPLQLPPHLYRAAGCDVCAMTGYKGRISIYEGIVMDKNIDDVLRSGNPSERELKEAAKFQHIPDMRQDGIIKVIAGVTTVEEVAREVGLTESR